jgi:hypothetical protein
MSVVDKWVSILGEEECEYVREEDEFWGTGCFM